MPPRPGCHRAWKREAFSTNPASCAPLQRDIGYLGTTAALGVDFGPAALFRELWMPPRSVENGLYVFTAHYLRKRGYCCQNACRNCPYGFEKGDPR